MVLILPRGFARRANYQVAHLVQQQFARGRNCTEQLDAPSDPRGRFKHSAERIIEVTSKASTSARSGPEKKKQMSKELPSVMTAKDS